MKPTAISIFIPNSTLLKVILLQAILIGASFATVNILNLDHKDISTYKSEDLSIVSNILPVNDKAYWVSLESNSVGITNNSKIIGEFTILNFYLSQFDGQNLKKIFITTTNFTHIYLDINFGDTDFNGSSSLSFKVMASGNYIYLSISETYYQMFPKGSELNNTSDLNGFPAIITYNFYLQRYSITPVLTLEDTYLISPINIATYNSTSQILMTPNNGSTSLYMIDFFASMSKLSKEYPLDTSTNSSLKFHPVGLDLKAYLGSLSPDYTIDMVYASVDMVDSLGRIHITGVGSVRDDQQGWTDISQADYVMIDPTTKKVYYWQLTPDSDTTAVKFVDLGVSTLVFLDTVNITGFYENSTYWNNSPDYNNTAYYTNFRHRTIQYAVVNFTNATLENYVQFDKSVSQTESHTILFPRLFNTTSLDYTMGEIHFSGTRFAVSRIGDTVALGVFLYKTSSGYRGSLGGCEASHGRDLVRQTFSVKGNSVKDTGYSGTLSTVNYDSCDDNYPFQERGWTTLKVYDLFNLHNTVYAAVGALDQTGSSVATYYSIYIYDFLEDYQ